MPIDRRLYVVRESMGVRASPPAGYTSAGLAACIALLAAATPFVAEASEGGATHYLPGGVATLIDLPPTKAG